MAGANGSSADRKLFFYPSTHSGLLYLQRSSFSIAHAVFLLRQFNQRLLHCEQEPKVEPKPRVTRSRAAGRRGVMSLIAIENHIHLALISLTVAPSTFLAFVVVAFVYLYIVHVRNNPLPRSGIDFNGHGHDRGVGRPIRRPSVFRRFSARLRTRKLRDRSITPLWVPFPSLWLPLRHRIRERRFDFWRQIQPASMAPRRKRQSQQRLLE